VDYILIGASLINIADMMIVGGLIIFLLFLQTKRR
jgi:lipoprotein signal peptidase